MHKLATAILSSALLVGCGGGGGGGSSGGTLALNAGNAQQVAQSAFEGATGVLATTSLGGDFLEAVAGRTRFDVASFARRRIAAILGDPGRVVLRATVEEETGDCEDDGTYVERWDDADGDGRTSSGDSFELEFLGCSEGGESIDGRIVLDQLALSGIVGSDAWSISLRLTFDGITIRDGDDVLRLDGVLTVAIAVAGDLADFSLRVLTAIGDAQTTLVAGTAIDATEDARAEELTIATSGGVSLVGLGGTITFSTTTPFRGSTSSDYPSSGVFVIRGAASSVTLVVLDEIAVRLDVDEDGDGDVDAAITTTWQALIG